MANKLIRRTSGGKLILLEYLYPCGGGAGCYTARAYIQEDKKIIIEHQKEKIECASLGRCMIEGEFYKDLGQLDLTGNALEKSHSDVYRLADLLFPELFNKGLKAEGYIKYSVFETEKAISF